MKDNKFYKRQPVKTPDSLINKDKSCNYGTFKSQFKNFNFQNYKLFNLPKFIKKHRLTRWEVVEASFGSYVFLGVVYKVGVLSFNMFILYDDLENKVYNFGTENLFIKKSKIAKSLLNKEISEKSSRKDSIKFINEFEKGYCKVLGHAKNKKESISFELDLEVISEPSIVSIPLTKNNPLYTEKDLMSLKGTFKLNGKELVNDSEINYAIIDDHRGYYPRKSGYDWLTTMSKVELNNKTYDFGFNLTYFYKNINQDVYNENGYWLNDKYHSLPVVKFYRENDIWTIKDEKNIVNITFKVKNNHLIYKNLLLLKIDYLLAFGTVSGYINTYSGEVITFKDTLALGEKRFTKL
ncbi:hypothetical protein CI105_07535 [Candidatus Izimaplasma bacterium ZiA1]|uniref:DUF2804 family protein n=1 Tax=Candidatus Izimoplasma sp. ZiA1 TaxID=2024899 RepID=UPI000BAA7A35|nr:hypothetical protein CI105_07535 [Candidatus Izimaplasma bacterium ZiA1]